MKEIEYKVLGVDDLELLVKIRIKDLKMFSNQKITNSTIENIRVFYKEKMLKDECHTLVGYHLNQIISTATIYYYDILPSNENSKGKVGQITNVWVDENYRHLGIVEPNLFKDSLIVPSHLPIKNVCQLFLENEHSHFYEDIIVLKNQCFYGIVTIKDLLKYLIK